MAQVTVGPETCTFTVGENSPVFGTHLDLMSFALAHTTHHTTPHAHTHHLESALPQS